MTDYSLPLPNLMYFTHALAHRGRAQMISLLPTADNCAIGVAEQSDIMTVLLVLLNRVGRVWCQPSASAEHWSAVSTRACRTSLRIPLQVSVRTCLWSSSPSSSLTAHRLLARQSSYCHNPQVPYWNSYTNYFSIVIAHTLPIVRAWLNG